MVGLWNSRYFIIKIGSCCDIVTSLQGLEQLMVEFLLPWLSFNLWLTRMISTILWVKSSSDLIPVSKIIDGLTVTGGTGSACKINHSGLAVAGS